MLVVWVSGGVLADMCEDLGLNPSITEKIYVIISTTLVEKQDPSIHRIFVLRM
jgi:hypothetical protein